MATNVSISLSLCGYAVPLKPCSHDQTASFLLKLHKRFAEPLREGILPAFQPQPFV